MRSLSITTHQLVSASIHWYWQQLKEFILCKHEHSKNFENQTGMSYQSPKVADHHHEGHSIIVTMCLKVTCAVTKNNTIILYLKDTCSLYYDSCTVMENF